MCMFWIWGEAFYCIVVNPLSTLWVTVFFKKLLSPVFRNITIKAVQKLFVCILQPCERLTQRCWMHSSGKILVSAMDTLLQHCSLQHLKRFYPFPLGPVHEKPSMNICCHPLRLETWMLQLLTGEHTVLRTQQIVILVTYLLRKST